MQRARSVTPNMCWFRVKALMPSGRAKTSAVEKAAPLAIRVNAQASLTIIPREQHGAHDGRMDRGGTRNGNGEHPSGDPIVFWGIGAIPQSCLPSRLRPLALMPQCFADKPLVLADLNLFRPKPARALVAPRPQPPCSAFEPNSSIAAISSVGRMTCRRSFVRAWPISSAASGLCGSSGWLPIKLS